MKNEKSPNYKGYIADASLKRTTLEKATKVIELYKQGYSQNYLEVNLKMTRKTIRNILTKAGVLRTKQEQTKFIHLGTTLREDAFDIIDDDGAYWLGFMYADGYITNPETTTAIGILLKESDRGHLEKFKEFLKAPQKIREGETSEYKNVSIKIGSQRLHSKLMEWGFTNNKSYDAKPPEFLKYNRHFWRGVIDGDGYLGIVKEYPRLHLCGTIDMVEGFRQFLLLSGVNTEAITRKEKDKNLYIFELGSEKAKIASKILYQDSLVYLDRKYQVYKNFPEEVVLFIGK